jgi:hypothetical protein
LRRAGRAAALLGGREVWHAHGNASEQGSTIMKSGETPDRTLREHHHHLEHVFDALVAQAYEDDPIELRAGWRAFEGELLRHLELEERELLPAFAQEHPAEAEALLGEHAQIRAALTELAITLDLHALRADAVKDFVERLKAHARREDQLFYGWAEAHAPRVEAPAGRERPRSGCSARVGLTPPGGEHVPCARCSTGSCAASPKGRATPIALSPYEARTLHAALVRHVEDLTSELVRTDSHPLQRELARNIAELEAIAGRLSPAMLGHRAAAGSP